MQRADSTRPQARAVVDPGVRHDTLEAQYREVRGATELLCGPLAVEDYVVQSMPDASPAKWHLAHTTWFFETFVLLAAVSGYRPFHPQYNYLFNSYYNECGERHCRARRGVLTRPTVDEVFHYRQHVDRALLAFLATPPAGQRAGMLPIVVLGLHHEQQHQELLLTDVKHLFSCNPLHPVYREATPADVRSAPPHDWVPFPEGLRWIGHEGDGFAYDNETPRHRTFCEAFALASRLVTNRDYLRFMAAGGYERPEFWLSDGWNTRQAQGWVAPLYWERRDQGWGVMTLAGLRALDENEPVCHVSYYEADAYARWTGARLPTEAEWESAAATVDIAGNFVESGRLHPAPAAAPAAGVLSQMFGDVWEWTSSPYTAYPRYRQPAAALGEYNGKFMCNQFVLRGGSCATPRAHMRASYRNFFPPDARWQFSGIRLARDV